MLRFSIRDLLLVTVIAAVAVSWWLDHGRQAAEIQRLRRNIFVPYTRTPTDQYPDDLDEKWAQYSGQLGARNASELDSN
jgi:hypothetical protein